MRQAPRKRATDLQLLQDVVGVLQVSVVVQVECGPERQHQDSVDDEGNSCQLPVSPEG